MLAPLTLGGERFYYVDTLDTNRLMRFYHAVTEWIVQARRLPSASTPHAELYAAAMTGCRMGRGGDAWRSRTGCRRGGRRVHADR